MVWRGFFTLALCLLHMHTAFATPNSEATLPSIDPGTLIAPIKDDPQRPQSICMALAIYHEARGGSDSGQLAVGHVILNRIKHTGKTICRTVWADHGSQFQWVRHPLAKIIPHELQSWRHAQRNAERLVRDDLPDNTSGATAFFNPDLCGWPSWARRGTVTASFDRHVFIRL